ncbi:hypothetical protein, partial [Sulfurimonas sp.]|uniref:hypothetical protein n=1 Tax=Sulfurimonas sp. TaxID=2022749 RepID=UPI0025DCD98C
VTVDKGNGKYLQTVSDADLSKMVESLKEKIIYPVRDSSTSQTQGHSLARPRGTRLTTSKTNVKHQSDKVSITQYSNKVDEFFAKTGKLLGDTEEKALGFISGGKVKRLLTVSQMTKDIGEITQDFRIGQSQIYSQASDIKKFLDNNLLPKDSQALFRALNGEEGYKLPEHLRETYTRFRTLIDKNANDLVEAGALKKENKISDYIKHYYEKHIEDGSFVEKFYFNSRFKARKSLTRDEQIALGMIEDSNFALPKTLAEQRVQLLKANTLKQVADKFGKKEIADGLVRMSDETMGGGIYKYGALAGKYVPKEVADAVKGAGLVKENMGILENYWYPIIDHIKVNVTVKNPFTHLYNVGSNVMLAFMRGDMTSFVRILNMAATDKKRFSELVKKANKYGLNSYLGEMENMDTLGIGKDPIMVTILKNAYLSKGSKTGDTARRMYDWEDKIFKLANFYNQIKKGIDEKRAFKLANEAYVDYTTPLPGAVRNLDKSGLMPFIHYSYKSTPMVLKTIAKHPFRFAMLQAAMIGTGASSWLGDNERENLYKPKWASSGFIPNVLGAKSWVDLGSGWYLNAGRLVPGMRFDGFDTLEFSGGFVGGTIKMLGGKTPLDYNIDGKYDDVPTKITKRILEMAKNYLPPLTFGRYGQRIVGKATGLYDPKNYYDEPMGYDEMLIRGAGVRHFNEKKELQSKVRAAKSTMKYKKKKSDSMLDKRKADTKFQLDLRKINSAARRKGLRLDKVR